MKLFYTILISDTAQILIAINMVYLPEVQDPSYTSIYFEILKHIFIWHALNFMTKIVRELLKTTSFFFNERKY